MRAAFNFFVSYYTISLELDEKNRLMFYDALFHYQFTGDDSKLNELTGLAKLAYISQKYVIESQIKGYLDSCKKCKKQPFSEFKNNTEENKEPLPTPLPPPFVPPLPTSISTSVSKSISESESKEEEELEEEKNLENKEKEFETLPKQKTLALDSFTMEQLESKSYKELLELNNDYILPAGLIVRKFNQRLEEHKAKMKVR